ncbi:DUF1624 domain-containing protein [Chloroflexota bacterium]
MNKTNRLLPLDALRGLIMALMALDHANHFVAQQHSSGENWGGLFPRYHDALPFLTRFVTHLAAPGFFFLMGVGMLLFARSRMARGWSKGKVALHFLIRGLVLIAFQFLVVNRAWALSPSGWDIQYYIGVLSALGITMILASLLVWLPNRILLALAVILLLGTELLVPAPSEWGIRALENAFDYLNPLLIHAGGYDYPLIWSNYPALPWLELVVFGIAFGQWLDQDREKAFKRGLVLGLAFLAAFVILRSLDGFGNIRPRQTHGWMEFLNAVKYPPSITFTLMTTGINLTLLYLFSWAGQKAGKFLAPLVTFGRVPLFFYVTHLFLYLGLGLWLTPHGVTLAVMYPYWLLGLLILYPLCFFYGRYKKERPPNSVLRFL